MVPDRRQGKRYARQASAWLTWAAYIPMAEARGFTPRFGKKDPSAQPTDP